MSLIPPLYRTDFEGRFSKLFLYCKEEIMPDLQACLTSALDTFVQEWQTYTDFEEIKCFAESVMCFLLIPGKARKYMRACKPCKKRARREVRWRKVKFELTEDFCRYSQGRPPRSHNLPKTDEEFWRVMVWTLSTLMSLLEEERPLKQKLSPIWKSIAVYLKKNR
jgi:hypothetical protein